MLNINYEAEPIVVTKISVRLEDLIQSPKVEEIEEKFVEVMKLTYGKEEPGKTLVTSNFKVVADKLVIECIEYNMDNYEANKKISEMKLPLKDVLFDEMGLEDSDQIMITKTDYVEPDGYGEEDDDEYFDPFVRVSIKMSPEYYNTVWTANELDRYNTEETLDHVGGQQIEPILVRPEEADKLVKIEEQYLASMFNSVGIPQELVDGCECQCPECEEQKDVGEELFNAICENVAKAANVPVDFLKGSTKLGMGDVPFKVPEVGTEAYKDLLVKRASELTGIPEEFFTQENLKDIDPEDLDEEQLEAIKKIIEIMNDPGKKTVFIDDYGNVYDEEEAEAYNIDNQEEKTASIDSEGRVHKVDDEGNEIVEENGESDDQ